MQSKILTKKKDLAPVQNSNDMTIDLPQYLDTFIFNVCKANYCPSHSDMMNIRDNKTRTLTYLGTYFPRSFAESYCIFSKLIKKAPALFTSKEDLSILDFCCGTGGEIIGMLTAFNECLPNLRNLNIISLDGNKHALKLFEKVLREFQDKNKTTFFIRHKESQITIDDVYDMNVTSSVLEENHDIILTFKALCEFVSGQQFDNKNPYLHFAETFLPKLNKDGLLIIEDITTKNDISQEWLPLMMDAGLKNISCSIIDRNDDFNQTIYVSHSNKKNDASKIAWRIIKNN